MSLVSGKEARVVLVTVPDAEVGARLARDLLEQGLIACANIVPGLRSLYRFEGKVCDDAEALLILKTEVGKLVLLEAAVQAQHPYETPEFLALPVAEGSSGYLEWLTGSL